MCVCVCVSKVVCGCSDSTNRDQWIGSVGRERQGGEERMSGDLSRGTQELMREAVKGDFKLHSHQESLKNKTK